MHNHSMSVSCDLKGRISSGGTLKKGPHIKEQLTRIIYLLDTGVTSIGEYSNTYLTIQDILESVD